MSERTFKLLIVSIGTVAVCLVLLLLGLTVAGPPSEPNLKAGPSGAPAPFTKDLVLQK
ncbi:MAG: hypothetical protein K9M54_01880 [Kiritimatiellales bacterium]|nr:hypothetical protein [Kiritimatiellales bacterium]